VLHSGDATTTAAAAAKKAPAHAHTVSWASQHIGTALALGFVVMLIVDFITGKAGHGHFHGPSGGGSGGSHHAHAHDAEHGHSDIKMTVFHSNATTATSGDEDDTYMIRTGSSSSVHTSSSPNVVSSSSVLSDGEVPVNLKASIGIMVHAAVDGIAYGAISVSNNDALEMIVLFAIMMHKVPAAFGLTSLLLHQGHSKAKIQNHLLVFSLAAPIMAAVSFLVLSNQHIFIDGGFLGLCLLFSGGTFLFTIAMHILPEVTGAGDENNNWQTLACLILGIFIPQILSGAHSHAH
jgi:zinc transporter ZupT